MHFEPVAESEIRVGQVIPWSLYDRKHKLVLVRGSVVQSERQIAEMATRGLFRKRDMRAHMQVRTEDDEERSQTTREEVRSLEEVKLAIGDTLNLQSQSDTSEVRYTVKLIGYQRGKGVIVSTPTQDGKVLLMRDGQSFIVRLFSGKSVYAFPATILKATNVPYPHLHLSWPAEVKGLVVRNSARAKVRIIVAITDAGGQSRSAMLDNLSIGGCALFSKVELAQRDERIRIKFRFFVGEIEQYLDLAGIVRSVTFSSAAHEGHPFQYGVQFVDIAPNEQLVLTAFVYHTLFETST